MLYPDAACIVRYDIDVAPPRVLAVRHHQLPNSEDSGFSSLCVGYQTPSTLFIKASNLRADGTLAAAAAIELD